MQRTENIIPDTDTDTDQIQATQSKGKLKALFQEIDNEKSKTKKKAAKVIQKSKSTKPKFVDLDHANTIIGLSGNSSNNTSEFKGLSNYGNICYSNVVMQCLISLKEFEEMLSMAFKAIEEENDIDVNFPIFSNLVKIMSYYNCKNTSLASNCIKQIVSIFDSSGEQNDAHEFLVFILDRLNDEILKISTTGNINITLPSSTDETEWEEVKKGGKRMKQTNTMSSFKTSIIGDLFQGVLKHELESKGKSLSKCNIEPFFVLSLDFGENSLDSCLSKFFSKRKIQTDNTQLNVIYQQTYIDKLPKILIVHLKAFYYDKTSKKIVKISKAIDFSTSMTFQEEFISPSMQREYKGVEYDLIAVIIHKGAKASEGHYICFCKNESGTWWNLDDKKVLKVDLSSLMNFKFRPYILFYRKL